MSKIYKVDMNIDVSFLKVESGLLMKTCPIEEDKRGYKEKTGPEVFAWICEFAINNANPKVSHAQLQAFRKVIKDLQSAAKDKGEYIGNKSSLDIIKNSITLNAKWPNSDDSLKVIDFVLANIVGAALVDENPTPNNPGPDSGEEK